eukprot:SAG22_NODE_2220_length_2822_cov_1.945648_1_plen_59_part_10
MSFQSSDDTVRLSRAAGRVEALKKDSVKELTKLNDGRSVCLTDCLSVRLSVCPSVRLRH